MRIVLDDKIKAVDLTKLPSDRVIKNRIYRVGIELEGAWDRRRIQKGLQIQRDGSVRFPELDPGLYYLGEVPSPPREVIPGSPTDFRAWLRVYYPHAVNPTCGMHVHMSFESALSYQRLMVPEYPKTIITYVNEWAKGRLPASHCIWERLAGNSVYCQHVFSADEQVLNTSKDFDQARTGNRYSVVNYAFSTHQTAECRLLPMMPDVEQAISAIEEVISITNKFLVATARKEPKVGGAIIEDEDKVIEIRSVSV